MSNVIDSDPGNIVSDEECEKSLRGRETPEDREKREREEAEREQAQAEIDRIVKDAVNDPNCEAWDKEKADEHEKKQREEHKKKYDKYYG